MPDIKSILQKQKKRKEDNEVDSILKMAFSNFQNDLKEIRSELDKTQTDLKQNLEKITEDFNSKIDSIANLKSVIESLDLVNIRGKDGLDGEDGATGEKGEKGDKGETGEKGEQGEKGKDGKNGLNGIDGIDGKDGKDGINGKDGSPDTPQDIAKKLNTLEGQILPKTIKGFDETVKDLKRALRESKSLGGGGGMGNMVHQSFTGDDSTTSFTLTYNVAGGGSNAMVFLNGQQLENSTHWSVSGTTLTLTFTPTTEDTIAISYIRA